MSSTKNLKTPIPKPKLKLSHPKESLTRRPIGNQRKKEIDENFDKTESEHLYPDISEYETENESDTLEENHDKESFEKSTKNISLKYPFEKSTRNISLKYLFKKYFAIILLFGGILIYYFNPFSGGSTEVSNFSDGKTEINVADVIKDMKNHFQNQHELTYGILKSQLKKVLSQTVKPSAPVIITLVANKGAELTASEFSQHLIRKLAPETHLLINDTSYWDDEPDNIISKIDEEIRDFAEGDHLSIIVVDKVENIPAKAAMIFHSYCDHEAAPYKRAIFLFIVPANKNIPVDASVKDIDRIAMDRLRNIWHEATNDLIDSLITRLTVSVVSVR